MLYHMSRYGPKGYVASPSMYNIESTYNIGICILLVLKFSLRLSFSSKTYKLIEIALKLYYKIAFKSKKFDMISKS